MAIHARRHTYDPAEALTPWVYAIARYKLIDHLRRTRASMADLPIWEPARFLDRVRDVHRRRFCARCALWNRVGFLELKTTIMLINPGIGSTLMKIKVSAPPFSAINIPVVSWFSRLTFRRSTR